MPSMPVLDDQEMCMRQKRGQERQMQPGKGDLRGHLQFVSLTAA
jgi:hypothetical protein